MGYTGYGDGDIVCLNGYQAASNRYPVPQLHIHEPTEVAPGHSTRAQVFLPSCWIADDSLDVGFLRLLLLLWGASGQDLGYAIGKNHHTVAKEVN